MNSVTFVGYGLAFLIAVIIAARWIYLHHPALRDSNLDPPRNRRKQAGSHRPGSTRHRYPSTAARLILAPAGNCGRPSLPEYLLRARRLACTLCFCTPQKERNTRDGNFQQAAGGPSGPRWLPGQRSAWAFY
jgi:hypothetical protein